MPSKRRAAKGRLHRITPETVNAFRAGDAIALHRALGLRPWQTSPLDADTPEPPPDMHGGAWADSWPLAFELRTMLENV